MRRFCLLVGVLMFLVASPAMAQDRDLDCANFDTQAEAQAELESDPSDPNGLDGDGDGIACEDLPGGGDDGGSGGPGGGGGTRDLDCANFATQEQAQAEFDRDPSDPNRLDADNDGIACEDLDSASNSQYDPEQPVKSPPEDVMVETIPKSKLPKTGGIPLTLPAAALLVAGGLIGARILRR